MMRHPVGRNSCQSKLSHHRDVAHMDDEASNLRTIGQDLQSQVRVSPHPHPFPFVGPHGSINELSQVCLEETGGETDLCACKTETCPVFYQEERSRHLQ